jgi:tRNA nucleotidyltransferase (CCA-adding enzyme)
MISINESEERLFKLLRGMIDHFKLDLTLRVAGGWVRDKILNRSVPTDIDIAIDKMTGETFVELLNKFLELNMIKTHGFGVIKKNIDKSKHLETATMKVFDYWIDFVNLRGCEYADYNQSDINSMGSPKEDAFHRDFTINALFYNININEVEDFTETGLNDLKSQLIRTPLDPFDTFLDDPLRVIRGFRFSARLGFKIDQLTMMAMSDTKIKEAFVQKISKERVGSEFMANFSNHENSCDFFEFHRLIFKIGYWPIIIDQDTNDWISVGFSKMESVYLLLKHLKRDLEFISLMDEKKDPIKQLSMDECVQFLLISILTINKYDPALKDQKKQFAHMIISDKLKQGFKYSEFVVKIQSEFFKLKMIAECHYLTNTIESIAIWQRSAHSFWPLVESLYNILVLGYTFEGPKPFDLHELLSKHDLLDFFKTKPLINGLEIQKIFGLTGKDIKAKQEEIVLWQMRNPKKTKLDFLNDFKLI